MSVKRATCPRCKKPFGVLQRQLGSDVYCPHCGQKMKTVAAGPKAESLQAAAAAQLFGPSDGEPADAAGTSPSASAEDDAAAALGAALGGGPVPAAPARNEVPVAQAAPPPGSDTALARHLGLDQQHRESSALASTPVRSKSVLWVWLTIIVLGLGTVLGVTVYKWRALERNREAVREARRRGRLAQPAPPADAGAARSERLAPIPIEEVDARTVEVETLPPPLTFHRVTTDSLYHETPAQREVFVGYVENYQDKVVRRARLNINAVGAESKKTYGEASIVFCDVQPEEKVVFAFDYPFVNERGTGFQYELLEDTTTRPEYRFHVVVRKIVPDGPKSGVITCDVTNEASQKARVVDVMVILSDAQKRPSGYATGQLVNLKAGQTQEARIRWEHWDRDYVKHAEARAQMSPEE